MTKRDILLFFFKWKVTIISMTLMVITSVTVMVYLLPVKYTGKAKVLVEPNRAPTMRTDISPGLQMGEAAFTEAEIILSYSVMESVVDKLKPYSRPPQPESSFGATLKSIKAFTDELELTIHMEPRDWWIRHLSKEVEVDLVMRSNILEVTYNDKNPEWAAKIVNGVIDAYIEHHFKVYMSSGNSMLYKEPMEKAEKALEDLQNELMIFKKKYSITATKERKQGLAQTLSTLRGQLTNSQVKLAELETKYKPGHPGHKEVISINSKIKQLNSSIAEANQELKEIEVNKDRVDALENKIESKKKTYEDHKRKYEEARLTEISNLDLINVRVVDYAPVPVRPNFSNLFYIIISAISGFILAVTVAFIKEYFDHNISDPAEVERILGIPEIGSVEKLGRRINS